MALLSSSSDILAFVATCRSWRAALASFPSTLSFNVPPLCLQSHILYPRRIKYSLLQNCEWQLTDPVKGSFSLRCSPHHNHPKRMDYLGCSYGNLIFSNTHECLLVDVFSFTTVRTELKSTRKHEIYYGILDAPLKSSNSHLFLCSGSSIFQWQVGSNSWLKHPPDIPCIFHILFFRGEMFARDRLDGIHIIRLAPQLNIHEVDVGYSEHWREDILYRDVMYWLVVCGDMFLMVDLLRSVDGHGPTIYFRVFRLDLSTIPPKWVKMENLGNHAIFVSFEHRNPSFYCTDPERWGGKSNCIYVATQSKMNDKPWTVVRLGEAVPYRTWRHVRYPGSNPWDVPGRPDNIWVFPSLVDNVGP